MKRRLVIVCVCLLLGAIVNVTVAWGIAYARPPRESYWQWHASFGFSSRLCDEVGWPAKTLGSSTFIDGNLKVTSDGKFIGDPNDASWIAFLFDAPNRARVIPFFPLWPGFAINTVFYAAIVWLLFAGTGGIRRFVRIRLGQCPACAYPIGTNPVCTECGKPVTVHAAKAIH